jgi:hypothetical protein
LADHQAKLLVTRLPLGIRLRLGFELGQSLAGDPEARLELVPLEQAVPIERLTVPTEQITRTDFDASQREERLMDVGTPLVPDAKPAVLVQPGQRPLDGLIANDKFCMTRLLRMAHEHRPTP